MFGVVGTENQEFIVYARAVNIIFIKKVAMKIKRRNNRLRGGRQG